MKFYTKNNKPLHLILLTLLTMIIISSSTLSYPCVYYFYGSGCSHCRETTPVIDKLNEKYEGITVKKLETWENKDNALLLQKKAKEHGLTTYGVPAVFIEDEFLLGTPSVINNIDKLIEEYKDKNCSDSSLIINTDDNIKNTNNNSISNLSPYTFWTITTLSLLLISFLIIPKFRKK